MFFRSQIHCRSELLLWLSFLKPLTLTSDEVVIFERAIAVVWWVRKYCTNDSLIPEGSEANENWNRERSAGKCLNRVTRIAGDLSWSDCSLIVYRSAVYLTTSLGEDAMGEASNLSTTTLCMIKKFIRNSSTEILRNQMIDETISRRHFEMRSLIVEFAKYWKDEYNW